MMESFHFITDTATICVFDPAVMMHRLNDDDDWWSVPEEELKEVRTGNAFFVGLGRDGRYEVEMHNQAADGGIKANVRCVSGRIFIGAAEEVTAGGFEPECIRGGSFVELTPGVYRAAIWRIEETRLGISFMRHDGPPMNEVADLLRLDEDRFGSEAT